jgi:2-keto-4-pentenoate hydratase/2-oxohepta-3-ene-1,7-dioic acid hydratase in catechol pathway
VHRIRFRDPSGSVRVGEYRPDDLESPTLDGTIAVDGRRYDPAAVEVLPPCDPSTVVCVGRNYVAHVDERDADVPARPLYFLKPPTAVAPHGATVELPTGLAEKRVEHEAELGVVVGERCRDLDPAAAADAVAGYTCVNDLSNRSDQRRESQWVRGKAFDGAAPVGPVLADPGAVPADATVECRVNGQRRQHGTREAMIFDVPRLLAELSQYLTLDPGDLVATGTPEGVGPLADGDRVAVTVEGVGTLAHTVVFP